MQLTISRTDLSRVLSSVGRVVETRNTIPILGHVRLSADGGLLRVTGTDLDIVATDTATATVDEPGAICVSAKLLSDIAKKAGAADVTLSEDNGQLIVKSGRSKFTLQTLPTSDFPDMTSGKYPTRFSIDLVAFVAPTTFAISSEETRYYLNGVFLKGEGGKLTAVATDGHRLARHVIEATEVFEGIIIPRKTIGLLPKGTVTLAVSESKVEITTGDFVITSKLIDGTFPDYERVIPRNNENLVVVDRDAFMKAADRVSTVSSERGRAVKLSIAPGSVGFTVSSPDSGSATDEIEAEYSGEPIDIGFNAAYLRDLFGVLPAGSATIAIADSGSPALFTSPAFDGLTLVGMPMRV
ncbi:DNA polymerase III subunit beta [Rhizobium sp. RCAM05973]|uniref:DNA polymerase III subunit beta n=1 Tax=Rhizobium sp. RCAM05973 TaxID=2994066 RepID=UPI0022EC06B5|nr:DNA polymerase III subunit beta [Rhizobium sp. RCAM05973]